VAVRAKICTVGGLSAHADQDALIAWLKGFHQPPGKVFVVHGEAGASADFAQAIKERLAGQTCICHNPASSSRCKIVKALYRRNSNVRKFCRQAWQY
jgi:predicted metal-dependent RNase